MLGTVYVRDINFAFQNCQSNANMFGSHGLEIRSFFYRSFALFVVCLPVFSVGLSTSFAARLEGETKGQGDCYLALAGGPS